MRQLQRYRRPSMFTIPEVEDMFKSVSDVFSMANREFPMEMYEEDNALVVSIDAPGYKPEDIEIRSFADKLFVKAKEEVEEECDESEARTYHCRKRRSALNYSINLPLEVNPDNVKATVKNGVVSVRLPKKEEQVGKVVEVEGEE
ncbi:MAG: Hsp20/alpha crystallin family protein [Synergistales bacterium]|nr:Hsp20/alpha crystallin family protein [Synergistales bacterium]